MYRGEMAYRLRRLAASNEQQKVQRSRRFKLLGAVLVNAGDYIVLLLVADFMQKIGEVGLGAELRYKHVGSRVALPLFENDRVSQSVIFELFQAMLAHEHD
jgi:hypothetical protein